MRGVAHQQHAGRAPIAQAIADHVEEHGMLQRVAPLGEELLQIAGQIRRHRVAPSVGAELAHLAEGALGDHPSDLQMAFGRGIRDHEVRAPKIKARGGAVEELARHVRPHHVEPLLDTLDRKTEPLAQHRSASVASHD